MATTSNIYNGDGSTTDFSFTFPYFTESDVKVSVDNVTQATSAYSFPNATTVRLTSAPASGTSNVKVYRSTDVDSPQVSYTAGSSIRAGDLNDNQTQSLYSLQERQNDDDVNLITDVSAGAGLSITTNSPAVGQIALNLDTDLQTLAGVQTGAASALAALTQSEIQILDGATVSTTDLNNVTNVVGGMSKETTLSPNSDVHYPTSKAVNDQITTVTNALGGFVAIDDEVSFPTTNPDPSDNAGTVVSIMDVGGLSINDSGVASGATTTGSTAVSITGFPAALRGTVGSPKVLDAGLGLQVQTTSTLNTYTYHKLFANESDVLDISSSVSSFNSRYRIAGSAPSGSLDEGDMWWDSTNNAMMIYDGSAWVSNTAIGEFQSLVIDTYSGTGGNSATFDGSAYRFELETAAGASVTPESANQLIVSLGGVVQQPSTASSGAAPSNGFAVEGSTIKFASAPANGTAYFINQIGTAVTIGTLGSQVVASANITDGTIQNVDINASAAIAGSKLADDSISEVKLDIHAAPTGTDKFLAYTSNGMEWAVPTNTNIGGATGGDFNDNVKLRWGTGNDLEVYHDGSNSYIADVGTGELRLRGTTVRITDHDGSENFANFLDDGAVELFHDNSKKFETTAAGATVTGTLTATLQANAIDSDHYVDGSIDTAHIGDLQVTEGKLADNAVTLAKMAGLARGKIIYGDASGDPAALAPGTANKVLTSDGTDISWEDSTATATLSSDAQNNTLAGSDAGASFTSTDATGNTLLGKNAGTDITSGDDNVCVGFNAANKGSNDMTTGYRNVVIGVGASLAASTNYESTVIGYNLVGKGNDTTYVKGNPYNTNNTTTWTTTSDQRIKKNITDNDTGLATINQIKVRNFEYRKAEEVDDLALLNSDNDIQSMIVDKPGVQIGVIAQEVESICPGCVKTESNGVKSVNTDELFWHMLNAIKQLSAKVTVLENK